MGKLKGINLVEAVAREWAADQGEDFEIIPFWKQLHYRIKARKAIDIIKRVAEAEKHGRD